VEPADVDSGCLGAEPSTPTREIIEDRESIQIADLIEEAWTKVESRNKNKKKRK
jgi:hypothetical protein